MVVLFKAWRTIFIYFSLKYLCADFCYIFVPLACEDKWFFSFRDKLQERFVELLAQSAARSSVPGPPDQIDESRLCGCPGKIVDPGIAYQLTKLPPQEQFYFGARKLYGKQSKIKILYFLSCCMCGLITFNFITLNTRQFVIVYIYKHV